MTLKTTLIISTAFLTGIALLAAAFAAGYYINHPKKDDSPSAAAVMSPDTPLESELKHVSTKQFLARIATSSPQERVALYEAHYELSTQLMTIIVDHLVGGDYVFASESATPYLMNKYGWDPIPAADMEIWSILEFHIITLEHPEILNPKCSPDCLGLSEAQITPKAVAVGGLTFSQQQVDEVNAELDSVVQNR